MFFKPEKEDFQLPRLLANKLPEKAINSQEIPTQSYDGKLVHRMFTTTDTQVCNVLKRMGVKDAAAQMPQEYDAKMVEIARKKAAKVQLMREKAKRRRKREQKMLEKSDKTAS